MACVARVAAVLFLSALISQAHAGDARKKAGCKLSDIKVTHERTGKVVKGYPEYRVTIKNVCSCMQDRIMVRCNHLPTVEPADSTQIKVVAELCMVAVALPGGSVKFTYAWKTRQDFTVVSSESECNEHDAIQG